MKSRRFWVLLFAVILVAVACGGDDDADSPTSDAGQSTTEDSTDTGSDDTEASDNADDESAEDDGGDAATASGTAFPEGIDEDFPVPVPAGWEIDILEELAEDGLTVTNGGVQVMYANDDFDRLVTFYDEWTGTDTADYVRSEAGDSMVYQRMESPVYQITFTKNTEEQGNLYTLLVIVVIDGG